MYETLQHTETFSPEKTPLKNVPTTYSHYQHFTSIADGFGPDPDPTSRHIPDPA